MSSEEDFGSPETQPGQGLAVLAEALFLLNLLALPGIAFLILAGLWLRHRHNAPRLARQHLRQASFVSFWGGLLIVGVTLLIAVSIGLGSGAAWVLLITYFTCIHSSLILLGMFALVKAMGGQVWRYPLIGPRLENDESRP